VGAVQLSTLCVVERPILICGDVERERSVSVAVNSYFCAFNVFKGLDGPLSQSRRSCPPNLAIRELSDSAEPVAILILQSDDHSVIIRVGWHELLRHLAILV